MTKTRTRLRLSIRSAALAAAVGLSAPAQADEFDSLLSQLSQATQELKSFEAEAPRKIEESLSLKKKHESEYAALDSENSKLDSEAAVIDSERPGVQSACQGTVPQDQLAAANARCNSLLVPFNSKVNSYNSHLDDWKARYADVDRREQQRFEAATALQKKYDSLKQRVTEVYNSAALASKSHCAVDSAGSSPEEVAHKQSVCWENANAALAVAIGQTPPKPSYSATPNSSRTAEQAIEEYKKSGNKPGPTSLKTKAPPPPPGN